MISHWTENKKTRQFGYSVIILKQNKPPLLVLVAKIN